MIAAKEKWSSNFIDFDFVINNLKKQNKTWFDVGKLSPASRDNIYSAICKVSMRSPIDWEPILLEKNNNLVCK